MSVTPADIESAIARIEALDDESARAAARGAIEAILGLHRACLERLLAAMGEGALNAAARDDLVAGVLLLHDLHPQSLAERVRAAARSATSAEILAVAPQLVQIRVSGDERERRAVLRAIEDAAPDVERVEVIASDPSIIPLSQLTRRAGRVDPDRGGRPRATPSAHERCDLCGATVATAHDHLFHVERRRLECVCAACAILFDGDKTSLRRVRHHARRLTDLVMTDADWQALEVPVGVAFFYMSSPARRVIVSYPGVAGAVESEVSADAWQRVVDANPVLAEMEPDTSALLVDRLSAERGAWLVSIDECFRLTGLVRRHWQGMTGGDGPKLALREFRETLEVAP